MALTMDDIHEIRARWKTTDVSHPVAALDVETLCSEVELLDVAWRAAEDACFDYSRELARLKGLLLKAKHSGALPSDVAEAIDRTLEEVA